MTYDQLIAFVAVVREGTFTAASAALHKSQPAISKLVRNLENELGVELFDRGRYRATPNDAGRLFHERAATVIESVEALKSFGMQLAGSVEPVVRVAVEAITPLGPIMAILRTVQDRYPAVRIELASERLAGAADALSEGRADLAIATTFGVAEASVELAHFVTVRIVPVARADHPLAAARGPVPRAMLRSHAQIVLRDSAQGENTPSLNVLRGGLRWSVDDVASKKEVIFAGMGWGGLPEHVVADALVSGELVSLDVPEFEVSAMELFAMRRRDRAFGLVATALWEELRRTGAAATRVTDGRAKGRRALAKRTRPHRRSAGSPKRGRRNS